MLKIGKIEFNNNAFFAPMAGFWDIGARFLARQYGAGLTYTEMVSAKGLLHNNKQTKLLLEKAQNEDPFAVQLFAKVPDDIYKAIKLLPSNIDIVDINMGCPAPKIVKNGEGSALLLNVSLAAEVVAAAVSASDRPVTVKTRIGFENDVFVADKLAKAVESAGASLITVHGRYRQQMYAGKVDLDSIRRVKESVNIPVLGNGDIKNVNDYHSMMEIAAVDGVMIGRGALGNYNIFSQISGENMRSDKATDIRAHVGFLKNQYPDRVVANLMKMHICYYASGMNGKSKQIREEVHKIISLQELDEIIIKYFT